jgi:acetylornithine deacetylase/succinyl-diaminopimelate desuccinylase-like protein
MIPAPRTAVARRRRHSARLALYLSLLAVGLLLAGTYAWMQPRLDFGMMTRWARIDWGAKPEVRKLQEYIRINTSTPPDGDPIAGARWFAGELSALGLEPTVEVVGGEANVWAVLEGRTRDAVVLHHHIDVDAVPNPEHWQYAPYGGFIDGPWIYGRGAFDMKSVAVAQLFAVEQLIDSGRQPERSVIVLATTGEESGSDLGTKWFLRQHPELVERFAVVLTEGGAVEGRTMDDLKYWGTELVQKRLVDVVLCGPRPALEGALASLRELGLLVTEPELVPEVERFLVEYAPTRDAAGLRELLDEPRVLLLDRPAYLSLSSYQRSFFEHQVFVQEVRGSDGDAHLRMRFVLLPGADVERTVGEVLPAWIRHGLQMQVFDEGGAAGGTSGDHWAFQAIDEAMAERRPDVVHGPLVLTLAATDARFFRAAGVPTFGFSPFGVLTLEVMQLRLYGTANERMTLPGFVEGVDLYARILERLVN